MNKTKLHFSKEIFLSDSTTKVKLPLHLAKISAGFASPADDFYKWLMTGKENKPYFIRLQSEEPFTTGIWTLF